MRGSMISLSKAWAKHDTPAEQFKQHGFATIDIDSDARKEVFLALLQTCFTAESTMKSCDWLQMYDRHSTFLEYEHELGQYPHAKQAFDMFCNTHIKPIICKTHRCTEEQIIFKEIGLFWNSNCGDQHLHYDYESKGKFTCIVPGPCVESWLGVLYMGFLYSKNMLGKTVIFANSFEHFGASAWSEGARLYIQGSCGHTQESTLAPVTTADPNDRSNVPLIDVHELLVETTMQPEQKAFASIILAQYESMLHKGTNCSPGLKAPEYVYYGRLTDYMQARDCWKFLHLYKKKYNNVYQHVKEKVAHAVSVAALAKQAAAESVTFATNGVAGSVTSATKAVADSAHTQKTQESFLDFCFKRYKVLFLVVQKKTKENCIQPSRKL